MTLEEVREIARKVGIISNPWANNDNVWNVDLEQLQQVVLIAAAREREQAAKLCESMTHPGAESDLAWAARSCAAAIRARSFT